MQLVRSIITSAVAYVLLASNMYDSDIGFMSISNQFTYCYGATDLFTIQDPSLLPYSIINLQQNETEDYEAIKRKYYKYYQSERGDL